MSQQVRCMTRLSGLWVVYIYHIYISYIYNIYIIYHIYNIIYIYIMIYIMIYIIIYIYTHTYIHTYTLHVMYMIYVYIYIYIYMFRIHVYLGMLLEHLRCLPLRVLSQAARLRQLEWYANSWYRKVQELADESATRGGSAWNHCCRWQAVVGLLEPIGASRWEMWRLSRD
jgi:hypothetical protein